MKETYNVIEFYTKEGDFENLTAHDTFEEAVEAMAALMKPGVNLGIVKEVHNPEKEESYYKIIK